MSKVFILALDGLEYTLVKRWMLTNLMQKKYGKIHLTEKYFHKSQFGINEMVPYTPTVWASFITGTPPETHNIRSIYTYGKILDFIRNLPLIRAIKGKKKLFWKIGLKPRVVNRQDLNVETIFDKISPSVAIDVPVYNEPTEFSIRLKEAFLKEGLKGYVAEIWRIYWNRKERVFKNLSKEWKLFMAYFKIADLMGHIHIANRPGVLKKVYVTLDSLALDLKRKIPQSTIFLIVSDHGMKPLPDGTGNHTPYAFYSLNINTDWRPKDITDFFPKIMEWGRR